MSGDFDGNGKLDLATFNNNGTVTALYNVSGQPAVNVPLYQNADGLPIGVMLAGRMGDEGTLISLSAQLEQARPWKDRHPPIW